MSETRVSSVIKKIKPLLATLIKSITTGDYSQRRESAIALSKFKGEKATDFLLKIYESDNIQDFMALALGNIESEKAVSLLMNALNDSQQEVRFNAAQALGMIKNDEAFNVLMEALNDYADANLSGAPQPPSSSQIFFEEDTIISAIIALGKIRNHLGVPLLKRLLAQEKSPRIRASIITSLGMMANERMLPVFQSALRDEDPRVRANAIEAIESIKSSSIVGIIQPYLDDPNNRVRANVAKAIWKYGDFDVSDALDQMLTHNDKWYRASAAYAIGETGDVRFIRKLAIALKDEDSNVRRNATNALKKIESKEALEFLMPLLDDPNFDVRVQAVSAIMRCDPRNAIEILYSRLQSEDNAIVRATIISCLGESKTPKFIAAILPYLGDPDARVVSNTVDSIQKLVTNTPPQSLPQKFKLLLSHEDNRVKSNAIKALWHWQDLSALDNLKNLLTDENIKNRQSATFVLGEIGAAISEDSGLNSAVNELIAELVSTKDADEPKPSEEQPALQQPDAAFTEPPAKSVVQEVDFDHDLELASNAVNSKEFESAEKICRKVLSAQPNNLKAILTMGNMYFMMKKYTESSEFYEKALSITPNLVKALYNLGTIYYFQKDYRKAQENLTEALKLYPKLLGAYLLLAQIFQSAGKTEETIQLLTKAIELSPRNPILYQKLAMFNIRIKHYRQAIEVLEKAIALSPLDVESHILLAYCFNLTSQPNEAFAAFDLTMKTCAQSPNPTESLNALMQGYLFIKSTLEEIC